MIAPISRFAHRAYYRAKGTRVAEYLRGLEESQWYRPERLRELQTDRLRRFLLHAGETVPFYRRRFAEADFDPQRFNAPEQMEQLPVLTKADIRGAGQDLFSSVGDRSRLIPYASGGSTGEPVTIYRGPDDSDMSDAALRREYRWYGFDVGDRLALLWGALRDEHSTATLWDRLRASLVNQLFLNAYDLTNDQLLDYARRMRRFRPRALKGYVTPLWLLARYLLDSGIDWVRPHVIVTGAEPLFEPQRDVIARAFACPVRNAYGGRESGHMAAECPEAGRLHLFEDTIYCEILRDGLPVGPGETGELVVTTWQRWEMPLIRYRVEDLVTRAERSCSCGRGLAVLDRIEGRLQDVIVTPNGRMLPGEFFTHLLMDQPVERFQIEQLRADSLIIRVVPGASFSAAVADEVERRVRGFVAKEMEITFETVERIDPTVTGKHRFVISHLSAGQRS